MQGKIIFNDVASLADFLRNFQGTTAVFEVCQDGRKFVLTFTGGY